MSYLKWALIGCLTVVSGACVRDRGDYSVPLGHPADAGARSGAVLVSSNNLEPELKTVRPQVGAAPGGQQHKH